jgi:hypothetical protein
VVEMARKSSTIHIEETFWNDIAEYMKENNIVSRNTAIEQMLMERRIILKMMNPQPNPTPRVKVQEQHTTEVESTDLTGDVINGLIDELK